MSDVDTLVLVSAVANDGDQKKEEADCLTSVAEFNLNVDAKQLKSMTHLNERKL